MARRSAEEAAISDRLNGQFEEAIAGHVTAAIMTFGGRMTKTSQEMFTYVARCPNCTDHGEKHMARHEWIVGQPETHRSDCEYCQRRDAITDGSVQLAMLKRIEKRARRVLKVMCAGSLISSTRRKSRKSPIVARKSSAP